MNCSTPYFLTCVCQSFISSQSRGSPSLSSPMLAALLSALRSTNWYWRSQCLAVDWVDLLCCHYGNKPVVVDCHSIIEGTPHILQLESESQPALKEINDWVSYPKSFLLMFIIETAGRVPASTCLWKMSRMGCWMGVYINIELSNIWHSQGQCNWYHPQQITVLVVILWADNNVYPYPAKSSNIDNTVSIRLHSYRLLLTWLKRWVVIVVVVVVVVLS